MRNVRILIGDLTRVAVLLGKFKIEAAGSMYATLELSHKQRVRLTLDEINWQFD